MAGFQITINTLRRTEAELQAQLDSVRGAIAALSGGATGARRGRPPGSGKGKRGRRGGKRKLSAAARKAISDAQKKRWAKQKAAKKE